MQAFQNTNIPIDLGQYLKDIPFFQLNGIPTNVIFLKALPGIGATSYEIEMMRNSIMIEPNVPVIQGKCKKYNVDKIRILGIYERISDETIADYLASDIPYKKIIVTPESFYRILTAIGPKIYEDYFLLFDECERTIQDVSYRSSIILPMFEFFKFINKAFISATPIMPSDPRFINNGFQLLTIKPTFDYQEQITILPTNNILLTLEKFLKENEREKYFIFCNSTDNIAEIILRLSIKEDSAIYCARDSRKKLILNDFNHVHTELKNFKKFNFLTSRFYSAVDIDHELYNCDPTIIMITDLIFAEHTMIDPNSEAFQIIGRFRKAKGREFQKETIHITNVNPEIASMTYDEVQEYLKECHIVYRAIHRYYIGATHIAAKETLKQMLERIDYSRFVNKHDGSKNYYMVDNLLHEEQVKGFYRSATHLLSAYKASNNFKVEMRKMEEYAFSDKDRLESRKDSPLKSVNRIVSVHLKELMQPGKYSDFQIQLELSNLQYEFPQIMVPINRLGFAESEKLNYDLYKIKEKLRLQEERKDYFGLMTYIERSFVEGNNYTTTDIENLLRKGIDTLKLIGLKPGVRLLRKFCELSKDRVYMGKNTDGQDIRGYRLIKMLD